MDERMTVLVIWSLALLGWAALAFNWIPPPAAPLPFWQAGVLAAPVDAFVAPEPARYRRT